MEFAIHTGIYLSIANLISASLLIRRTSWFFVLFRAEAPLLTYIRLAAVQSRAWCEITYQPRTRFCDTSCCWIRRSCQVM